MQVYLDLVVLLNFLVDFLLLLAVNRLCGYPPGFLRCTVSAGIGGIYAGVCMIPGFQFLGNLLWRLLFLSTLSVAAFGWNRSALRRGIILILLTMALGGIAVALGNGGFLSILLSAFLLLLLCAFGVIKKPDIHLEVPVELIKNNRKFCLTALKDTGNLLRDPITGQQVLIVGPKIAWDVLGLTSKQLAKPIETIEENRIQGLRLIPYSSVGQSSGILLAVKFDKVTVDGEEYGQLVAFSPNSFGTGNKYQALAGGYI